MGWDLAGNFRGPAGPTPTGVPLGSHYRALGSTSVITSTIAGGYTAGDVNYAWTGAAGKFRFCGTVPEAVESDAGLCLNNNSGFAQSPHYSTLPTVIEFWSDATTIIVNGSGLEKQDVWAVVDDKSTTDVPLHMDFDTPDVFTWTLTQPDPVWRKWRLCYPGIFFSLWTNTGATIVETTPGLQLAIIGDSFIAGNYAATNGNIASGALAGQFEQLTGFDVWRLGVGATGYLAQGPFGTAGQFGSTERMAKLAGFPAMDAVVVIGSVNDSAEEASDLVTAANAAWSAIKVAQPTAPLIVAGIQCGTPGDPLDTLNAALKTAAEAHSDVAVFVDLRTHPFITGTGHEGAATGDGNADVFTSPDGLHPSDPGCRWWGENLKRLCAPILV